MRTPKTPLAPWIAAVAPALLAGSLVAWSWGSPGTFFTVDIAVKDLQVRACIEHDCTVPYTDGAADPDHRLRPIQPPFAERVDRDRYETVYRNLLVRASAPVVEYLGPAAQVLIPVLSLGLVLWAAAALGSLLGTGAAWGVFAAGAMTPLWFYGAVLWEHLPATAAVTWMIVLLIRPAARPLSFIGAGLLLALATSLRPEAGLVGASLMAALLWDRRRDAIRPLLLIGATALAGVGVLLALDPGLLPVSQVQHNVTGGGFELKWWLLQRMEHGVQAFAGLNEAQPRHGMLEYREFPAFAPSLALAVLWGGLLLAGRRAPADDGRAGTWLRLTALVLAAGLPLWRLSVGVPQPTGLLITSPLVLLLAGAPSEGNARWLYRGSVLFLFLALLTMPNGGGSQIGPRYLLPVVPLLAVLAAAEAMRVLKSTDARPVQLVVRGALGASLFVQLLGLGNALIIDAEKDAAMETILSVQADAYASADGFVPCELASLLPATPIYFLPDARRPEALIALLRSRGVRKLAMIGRVPRAKPRGAVTLGPYVLARIVPFGFFPRAGRAVWEFVLPGGRVHAPSP